MKKKIPPYRRVLFWDTDPQNIDWEKNARFVLSRIMHRGTWEEWLAFREFYGDKKILSILPDIKWQDPLTENFIKTWYQDVL